MIVVILRGLLARDNYPDGSDIVAYPLPADLYPDTLYFPQKFTAEVYSPNLSGIGHNELIVGKAQQAVCAYAVRSESTEDKVLALREDQGDFRYKPGKDDSALSRLGGLLGIECFDADVAGGKIGIFYCLYVAARQEFFPRTAVAVYK